MSHQMVVSLLAILSLSCLAAAKSDIVFESEHGVATGVSDVEGLLCQVDQDRYAIVHAVWTYGNEEPDDDSYLTVYVRCSAQPGTQHIEGFVETFTVWALASRGTIVGGTCDFEDAAGGESLTARLQLDTLRYDLEGDVEGRSAAVLEIRGIKLKRDRNLFDKVDDEHLKAFPRLSDWRRTVKGG